MIAGHDHYPLRKPFDFENFVIGQSRIFEDMTSAHEFRPKHMNLRGLQPRRLPYDMAIAYNPKDIPIIKFFDHANTDIGLWISSGEHTRVIVNQFYFPGWKVEVNDTPAAECPPETFKTDSYCFGANGRIVIRLASGGEHRIHVWYDGVPGAAWRNTIALTVAAYSVVALWWLCRPKRQLHPISA